VSGDRKINGEGNRTRREDNIIATFRFKGDINTKDKMGYLSYTLFVVSLSGAVLSNQASYWSLNRALSVLKLHFAS
jgi:hypothetical protein